MKYLDDCFLAVAAQSDAPLRLDLSTWPAFPRIYHFFVAHPRGVVHPFDNFHADGARMQAIVTPGILGPGYFREIKAASNAAAGGPPDPAAIAGVMRRF